MWRIEVKSKDNIEGDNIKKDIEDVGIKIDRCEVIKIYLLFGNITKNVAKKIAEEVIIDKVSETYEIRQDYFPKAKTRGRNAISGVNIIEVAYNAGVMDPVEASTIKAIQDLGIKGISGVRTAKKYILYGNIGKKDIEYICDKLLVNNTTQHIVREKEGLIKPPKYKLKINYINLIDATDYELESISKNRSLGLNLLEMKTIQEYYKKLGRAPTDIEIETIAQTWSEHCIHKTFKSKIEYKVVDNPHSTPHIKIIEPLMETIQKATKEINKNWCISVFKDNAGIVDFTEDYAICFKVETHNHPSALEPYGGAGTGIGGVIRDILGCGLGAKPIFNTDVFCFAPPDYPHNKLPKGTLHPKRIMKGVVAGVRDYGNKMGIPTINGSVVFDEKYVGNPVVYCGTCGIMPKDKCTKKIIPGDKIVLLGGRTGRDGIHGVTFASLELTDKSEIIHSQAVQIGNPIEEKKLIDALLIMRDKNLYNAITDCGGGGLSSAIGELAKPYGAIVELDKVPLKYEGLSYWEIWISEAQERMIIFAPPQNIPKIMNISKEENLEATVIGEIIKDKKLVLKYKNTEVGNIDMTFLHEGIPLPIKKAEWMPPQYKEPKFEEPKDLTPYLLKILSALNVCSKEWIIRQYDHEVQGGSVLKPIVGLDGPSDASIVKPIYHTKESNCGVVVSCGINPKYGKIDPYWMAASAIDESIRNIVAVGGNPDKIALLDNFSWGNPNVPERLGELVRAVQGCYDIAKAYKTPFISGKDSLNNEYSIGDEKIAIPPTLLISAISIIDDINYAVSMDFKQAGNPIYIIGKTYNELGGSHYYELFDVIGNNVPKVRPNLELFRALNKAIKLGIIRACHDCSEGGIGVAVAEMCFAGNLGAEIYIDKVIIGEKINRSDFILFSESNSRFIVEIDKQKETEFNKIFGNEVAKIGITTKTPYLKIYNLKNKIMVSEKITHLKEYWQKPFKAF